MPLRGPDLLRCVALVTPALLLSPVGRAADSAATGLASSAPGATSGTVYGAVPGAVPGAASAGAAERAADVRSALLAELQARPADAPLRIRLAVQLAREGALAEARSQLEAVLRRDPASAHAFAQLQRLNAEMARQAYARAGLAAAPALTDLPRGAVLLQPLAEPAPAAATAPTAQDTQNPPTAQTPDRVAPSPSAGRVPAAVSPGAQRDRTAAPQTWTGWEVWGWPLVALLLALAAGVAWAARPRVAAGVDRPSADPAPPVQPAASRRFADPEQRLLEVYRLIGTGRLAEALAAAQALSLDEPTFALGQQVYGDLLLASGGQLADFAQPTTTAGPVASPAQRVESLRREALLRLQALQTPPPEGRVPRQFLVLPPGVRHALAVDTSRSRLYLFEHRDGGLILQASYYVSLGSQGVGKRVEGDQRTPLGVYHITRRLEGPQIGAFYGPGALPLNYPNEHDRRLGRSGANIWLHGSPPDQYARAPRATNGCIVLANDDLRVLLRALPPQRTPVVIAQQLEWVLPQAQQPRQALVFELLERWRQARASADLPRLAALYARHFDNGETGQAGWRERLAAELARDGTRERRIGDLLALGWQEQGEQLLLDFVEQGPGHAGKPLRRRQYWAREGGQWQIFSEGVIE